MGHNGLCTPPHPKSPPEYPDACGKHRLKVAVEALNQEIDYLQRELNLIEGTVPASRCCKELHDYVSKNPDPLIKVYEKRKKSCCIWNIFRAILCCNWGCVCCTGGCLSCPKRPKRCCFLQLENILCCKRSYIDCTGCNCCKNSCCSLDPLSPCIECSCGCVCSCSRCSEICVCPRCTGCCKALCIC